MEEIICAWCKTSLQNTNKNLIKFDIYYCRLSGEKLFFCHKEHLISFFSRLHKTHPQIDIQNFYKVVSGGLIVDIKKVLNYALKGTFIRNKGIRK